MFCNTGRYAIGRPGPLPPWPGARRGWSTAFSGAGAGWSWFPCWRENADVMIELSDDGKGFEVTDDALAPHPERKRIGVANVNDRIQLNFGRKYGLKINSQPGKGTTCTLTLPELYADTLS